MEESPNAPAVVSPDGEGVKDPVAEDVLCGRGGSINSHPGNEKFRTLVEKRKRVYLTARFKREKRLIASSIVNEIRASKGRFLSRDAKTGLWKDIGDEKARDKTSQALRENAPSIRAEIEEEINEQRAELYKEEQSKQQPHCPPHPPPPPGSYYNGWYPPYYHGYGHPPPPPPGHAPAGYQHSPPPGYPSHPPPPPPFDPRYYSMAPDPYTAAQHPSQPSPPPQPQKDVSSDFVTAGAESFRNWTKTSFSFGGGSTVDGTSSVASKPIAYKHERKMVKFRDHGRPERRSRPAYSPLHPQDHHSLHDMDMEPQPVDSDPNTSLMTQVANHILGNFGSWDGVCGGGGHDAVPFPKAGPSIYTQDNDMTVEWEGQEVQLVEERREEESMPPPQPRESAGASIGLSSLGSCHSWLPEQMGAAASYFSGRDMDSGPLAPENHSMAESLGGNSLTRIFENEAMNHRSLNQVPSWERSLRSRSPLSLGDDDESLISKTSSKGGALSPVQSAASGEMAWTSE